MGLREDKKHETREALYQTAIDLFRTAGFESARVQDVAERVRVSQKTFYNYFPTKDAILDEFVIRLLDDFCARASVALEEEDGSVRERIRALFLGPAELIPTDPEFAKIVFQRSRLFRAEGAMLEKERTSYELLANLFQQGQTTGQIRQGVAPMVMAESLFAVYYFTTYSWLGGWWGEEASLPERLSAGIDLFFDGCTGV